MPSLYSPRCCTHPQPCATPPAPPCTQTHHFSLLIQRLILKTRQPVSQTPLVSHRASSLIRPIRPIRPIRGRLSPRASSATAWATIWRAFPAAGLCYQGGLGWGGGEKGAKRCQESYLTWLAVDPESGSKRFLTPFPPHSKRRNKAKDGSSSTGNPRATVVK